MKFSVLLNNFNYGRYVGEAIESVLNQTYQDFELLIVDDGSTDNSREVISGFRDSRIRLVFKENGGQASAFIAGFEQAQGDYIAFLDSDDQWAPNKLQRCADVIQQEPDVVLLNHGFDMIDRDGKFLRAPQKFTHIGRYDLLADLRKLKASFPLVPTSFFVGRRKECTALSIELDQWKVGADTPVIVGLGLRGDVYNLDATLGSYRAHGENLWNEKFDDEFFFQHTCRFYKLANEELKRIGSKERFNFMHSETALARQIMQTSKYSALGIWARCQKYLHKLW